MSSSDINSKVPAYLIALVRIDGGYDRYMQEYALPVMPIVAKYQGEVLVATSDGNLVEGVGQTNWTVILRFPNRLLLDAWYFSAEYEPFKTLRKESLTKAGEIVLVDGFDLNSINT